MKLACCNCMTVIDTDSPVKQPCVQIDDIFLCAPCAVTIAKESKDGADFMNKLIEL